MSNDKPQVRGTDASQAGGSGTDSGETPVTSTQNSPQALASSPSGEQTGGAPEQPGKPAATAGTTAPQPARDNGPSAHKSVAIAAPPVVPTIAVQEKKPASETSTPPYPAEKVEVKIDKASS